MAIKKGNGKKIRDLCPAGPKPYGVSSRYLEYLNLLMNAVRVTAKDGTAINFSDESFLKQGLFESGVMGYDKLIGQWANAYGEGVDDKGNPTRINFVTANGKTWARPASYEPKEDGAYYIKGLPIPSMTMGGLIYETTEFMANCDVAMRQNVEACKTPYIVVCKDDDLRLSFEQAIQQKQSGQAVVLVSSDLGDGLKTSNIGVQFLADKFKELRDGERNTLLNKLGIMGNGLEGKKERVQTAEVDAYVGQSVDYIYMLIDTFNKQCKSYGLDFKMSLNGSLEEIYTENEGERENDNK